VTALIDRVAGAPASWGICEVQGWGHQLRPERVLGEMHQAGIGATELGPDGFLPGSPREQAELLAAFGLSAIGAFCPLVLYDARQTPESDVQGVLERFATLDADLMVIAAATGQDGYDERPQLDDRQWTTFFANLELVASMAAEQHVRTCIHPHVGTLIETPDEVTRVLDNTGMPLCLDTGHLLIGGSDPVALAQAVPERIAHVHLKDVDHDLLTSVRSSERTYTEAVRLGMYKPLGRGSVDIPKIVRSLEASGYQGWYVPEQDKVLATEPGQEETLADVRDSIDFLQTLA
jgi:inosose dehydratase